MTRDQKDYALGIIGALLILLTATGMAYVGTKAAVGLMRLAIPAAPLPARPQRFELGEFDGHAVTTIAVRRGESVRCLVTCQGTDPRPCELMARASLLECFQ